MLLKNIVLSIIAPAIAIAPGIANAQEKDILREACSSISQPAKRLSCYDSIDKLSKTQSKGTPRVKKKTPEEIAIDSAKERVLRLLNDPDSAKFTSEEFFKSTEAVCGFVHAHNAMGGYGDPHRYIVTPDSVRIEGAERWKFDYRWSELCTAESGLK